MPPQCQQPATQPTIHPFINSKRLGISRNIYVLDARRLEKPKTHLHLHSHPLTHVGYRMSCVDNL